MNPDKGNSAPASGSADVDKSRPCSPYVDSTSAAQVARKGGTFPMFVIRLRSDLGSVAK